MGQLNHAIHFYIYTLTGGVFRNELIKLFSFSKYNLLRSQKSSSMRRINQTNHTNDQQHQQQLNSVSKQKTHHLTTET